MRYSDLVTKTRVFITVLIACAGIGVGLVLSRTLPVWSNDAIIAKYLRTHRVCKLQIGAGGNNLPGWLNTDIEPSSGQAFLDATKPFPLPDRSIDYIFGEHVIEHLSYSDGLVMLSECYRVLRPGGKIRFSTPDLRQFIKLLDASPDDEAAKTYIDAKFRFHGWEPQPAVAAIYIMNEELRGWGHQFLYDESTLRTRLRRTGFESIARCAPGVVDDPELAGIEARHKNPKVRTMNDYESMVLQARRPANH